MKPIHHYRDEMKNRGEEPLFRIPVDLGVGCPHRDIQGRGGCTFCPEHGSRAMQIMTCQTIEEQLKKALLFARNRYRAKRFMLYCQAFSSTVNLDAKRKALFHQLLRSHPFDAISIGTRPDCLGDDVLDFLQELQQQTEVWIELGVQTVHNKTLRRIQRGHTWETSREAILRLHERNINVLVHVILGLPGENKTDFIKTADQLTRLPIDGIKLHNLHVIRNTQLAKEYRSEPFPVFLEHDYAECAMDFLRHIPSHWPVMRLCTDTPPDQLLAPIWSMTKGAFLEYVERQMIMREWSQGDSCALKNSTAKTQPLSVRPVTTEDGSLTFWNDDYKEHYHTPVGARLEAIEKYIRPARLSERIKKHPVELLDICFGLGYNTLCACEQAQTVMQHPLHVTALEMDRRVVGQAAQLRPAQPDDMFSWSEKLHSLHDYQHTHTPSFDITLHWGDARHTIQQLNNNTYDILFLDAFSTQRNSELWTLDFFKQLARVIRPDGVLLTYCAALPVRGGLLRAGFYLGETDPIGRKRPGTLASLDPSIPSTPLNLEEQDLLLNTDRGRPYRDPNLCRSNKEILRTRQNELLANN